VPNINFFSKVVVDDEGAMRFVPDNSKPGDFVDLRAEMDTLVVLNTCPHPLDPSTEWAPRPVEIAIRPSEPMTDDDACLNACPENGRGFANTAIYHCQY